MLLFAMAAVMASCNNEKKDAGDKKENTMTSAETKQERNKKVILASMDAFAKHDIDAMLKDAAPGAYTEFSDGTMPPTTSIDSTKAFIKMLDHSIENYAPTNAQLAADGDYVFYYADWSGTFKNDFMGFKATGKPIKHKDCDIFKFNDEGKITEHHSVQNVGAMFAAFAMMK